MNGKLLPVIVLLLFWAPPVWSANEMNYGRFGTVTVYGDVENITSVALFVSGDGGWNQGVVEMARSLVSLNALVIGIDIRTYLTKLAAAEEKCSYPAADFEALSKYVQRQMGRENYIVPVLVGYSSGATLVYATLAQAPPGTFVGAISMGFCPNLPVQKPFCTGYGLQAQRRADGKGYDFLPTAALKVPWIAFQGDIDQVCDPSVVAGFVGKTNNAELVVLPHVGHGFSVQKNWLPQFKKSYLNLIGHHTIPDQSPRPTADEPVAGRQIEHNQPAVSSGLAKSVEDLPLVELPGAVDNQMLAIIVTGDGGWAAIDRSLGESLLDEGISVVGFNSLKYFWKLKTPEQSAVDLQRVISHYLAAWGKQKVVLIGYSQGADVLPFMVSRLPEQTRNAITGIALLGLAEQASFEITVSGWVGRAAESTMPIAPELRKLEGFKVICIYGAEENDTLCPIQPEPVSGWQAIEMPGGHHFGNDFKKIAAVIGSHLDLPVKNK